MPAPAAPATNIAVVVIGFLLVMMATDVAELV